MLFDTFTGEEVELFIKFVIELFVGTIFACIRLGENVYEIFVTFLEVDKILCGK